MCLARRSSAMSACLTEVAAQSGPAYNSTREPYRTCTSPSGAYKTAANNRSRRREGHCKPSAALFQGLGQPGPCAFLVFPGQGLAGSRRCHGAAPIAWSAQPLSCSRELAQAGPGLDRRWTGSCGRRRRGCIPASAFFPQDFSHRRDNRYFFPARNV